MPLDKNRLTALEDAVKDHENRITALEALSLIHISEPTRPY